MLDPEPPPSTNAQVPAIISDFENIDPFTPKLLLFSFPLLLMLSSQQDDVPSQETRKRQMIRTHERLQH